MTVTARTDFDDREAFLLRVPSLTGPIGKAIELSGLWWAKNLLVLAAAVCGCKTKAAPAGATSSPPDEGVPVADVLKVDALQPFFALRCYLDASNPATAAAERALQALAAYACERPQALWFYIAQCPAVIGFENWWLQCDGVFWYLPPRAGA